MIVLIGLLVLSEQSQTMSEPYIPGLEAGTSLEGNIEISNDNLKNLTFVKDDGFEASAVSKRDLSDFGDKECNSIIEDGENMGFESIRGVRDDYRSCKR